jgi:hypothetical protein
MKLRFQSALFFFLVAFIVLSCSLNNTLSKDKSSSKNKSELEIAIITSLTQSEYKIKLGQQISYSFREHGSVGISAEHELSDDNVLLLKERNKVYKNKDRKHLAGADNSTVTLIFEGKAIGSSDLIVRKMYRGDIKEELIFNITVE